MEASHLLHHGGLLCFPASRRASRRSSAASRRLTNKSALSSSVVAAMTEPKTAIAGGAHETPGRSKTLTTPPTRMKKDMIDDVYSDNWFDRLAIHHLSKSIEATTGIRSEKEGYESLVEAASMVARNFGAKGQQDLVMEALKVAIPEFLLNMIRVVMPPSKFSREYFARFTTVFFPWLIGHCEVRESVFEGRKENNVVYIPKCRFLEATNCAGMCTNLCKMPSQKFIHDSLGMPVNMIPNFEDMSCEMIFGQNPPEDDPALKQPCYQKICKAKQMHRVKCSS